jgi:hypothetical protein
MVAAALVGIWLCTDHDTPTALDVVPIVVPNCSADHISACGALLVDTAPAEATARNLYANYPRFTPNPMRAAIRNAMSPKQLVPAGVLASTTMLINAALQWRGTARSACSGWPSSSLASW